VEDGFKLGRLTFDEAEQCLVNMLSSDRVYKRELDQNSNIGWLRAHAIGSLIDAVQVTFEENEDSILDGSFSDALIDVCSSASAIKAAKALVVERVFEWDRTIAAEIAGSEMITFILERCMSAIYDPRPKMNSLILKLIPGYDESESLVKKIHSVTDFVSGMTDTYLKTTYLKFSGHLI